MEEPQTSFKTREVYDLIQSQYRTLNKEHENLFVEKIQLQRQIISPERAISMAKNIFVHGDFKRLREYIRWYKKVEQLLNKNIAAYNQRLQIFKERQWQAAQRSIFLQEKTLLSLKRSRLDKLNVSLKEKQTELETLCCQPDAAKKIEEIAAGIFRKNYKFVRQLEEFVQNVHHTGEQLDDLEIHLTRDKTNTHYRIICSDTLSNSKEAIFFDPQVIANCNAIKI